MIAASWSTAPQDNDYSMESDTVASPHGYNNLHAETQVMFLHVSFEGSATQSNPCHAQRWTCVRLLHTVQSLVLDALCQCSHIWVEQRQWVDSFESFAKAGLPTPEWIQVSISRMKYPLVHLDGPPSGSSI